MNVAKRDLIERLSCIVDDPMWANHVEMSKRTLQEAIDEICRLRGLAAAPLQTPEPAQAQEPAYPHIVEALSWHANERDDLSLDDAVDVIRNGWKKVHGRSERQLVLQIASLLASAPAQLDAGEVNRLRQGLWDVYAALGCDTDGDKTPVALVGDIVALVLDAAKEARNDYDDALASIPSPAPLQAAPDDLQRLQEHADDCERAEKKFDREHNKRLSEAFGATTYPESHIGEPHPFPEDAAMSIIKQGLKRVRDAHLAAQPAAVPMEREEEAVSDSEILLIGAQLANVAFNWAQHEGKTLTAHDCSMLKDLQKQWDAARALSRVAPAIPPGYAMVPKKPTPVMVSEAWRALIGNADHAKICHAWEVMIAAAPSAEKEGS